MRKRKIDGSMDGQDAESLLADADNARPDSDFVVSVWDWFDERGFITRGQADALERIVDG